MTGTAKTTRLRKVACPDCGYTARITRSWLEIGLPGCCCGGRLEPTDPADRAIAGLLGQGDVSGPEWTAICRQNGWEMAIMRKGAAAKAYQANGGDRQFKARRAQCAFSGCGKFVAAGHSHCHDHDPVAAVESMPF